MGCHNPVMYCILVKLLIDSGSLLMLIVIATNERINDSETTVTMTLRANDGKAV